MDIVSVDSKIVLNAREALFVKFVLFQLFKLMHLQQDALRKFLPQQFVISQIVRTVKPQINVLNVSVVIHYNQMDLVWKITVLKDRIVCSVQHKQIYVFSVIQDIFNNICFRQIVSNYQLIMNVKCSDVIFVKLQVHVMFALKVFH